MKVTLLMSSIVPQIYKEADFFKPASPRILSIRIGYTSRFLTCLACVVMNFLRGGTLAPISMSKV